MRIRVLPEYPYGLEGRFYWEHEIEVEADDIESAGKAAFDAALQIITFALNHPIQLESDHLAEEFEYDHIEFFKIDGDRKIFIDPSPHIHRYEL